MLEEHNETQRTMTQTPAITKLGDLTRPDHDRQPRFPEETWQLADTPTRGLPNRGLDKLRTG